MPYNGKAYIIQRWLVSLKAHWYFGRIAAQFKRVELVPLGEVGLGMEQPSSMRRRHAHCGHRTRNSGPRQTCRRVPASGHACCLLLIYCPLKFQPSNVQNQPCLIFAWPPAMRTPGTGCEPMSPAHAECRVRITHRAR